MNLTMAFPASSWKTSVATHYGKANDREFVAACQMKQGCSVGLRPPGSPRYTTFGSSTVGPRSARPRRKISEHKTKKFQNAWRMQPKTPEGAPGRRCANITGTLPDGARYVEKPSASFPADKTDCGHHVTYDNRMNVCAGTGL